MYTAAYSGGGCSLQEGQGFGVHLLMKRAEGGDYVVSTPETPETLVDEPAEICGPASHRLVVVAPAWHACCRRRHGKLKFVAHRGTGFCAKPSISSASTERTADVTD